MPVKRYRRKTLQDALRAVREEMGPDALVLSTRDVVGRGFRGWFGAREIEITAAGERQQMSETRHEAAGRPVVRPSDETSPRLADRPSAAAMGRGADALTARLEAAGLDRDTAQAVIAAHPAARRRGASTETLRAAIASHLSPLAAVDGDYAPIEVFVGPPGVGKTTTIAKIAAQARARQGRRLSMLAADGFRVGAVEQLRLYADILGAPFAIARTAGELEAAIERGRGPLLLDTAGRSPRDEASRDMFRLLASRSDVRTHLVLAATTPRDLARRIVDRFAEANPTRVVVTRVDEAESLGPMVPVLQEHGLPVSYLGTGQNVPDDLERATPAALAAWITGDLAHLTHAGVPA